MPPRFSYKNDFDEDKRVSPNETARSLHEQEQQSNFDKDFNQLTDSEHLKKDGQEGDLSDAVRSAESEPTGGFYKPSPEGKKTRFSAKGFFRKKGAIGVIIAFVFGTGLGFSALLSPSLLIVHMKEIMVEKFDTQLTTIDARSNRLTLLKNSGGTTSGLCSGVINLKCKFSTMSKTEVENFKNAGITVQPETPNAGNERTKPTGYSWKGNTYKASEFAGLAKSDSEFKVALKRGYNPKYAGLNGKAWSQSEQELGISKKAPDIDGNSDEERMKKLNEVSKNGENTNVRKVPADFESDNCDAACADKAASDFNSSAGTLTEEGTSGRAAKNVTSLLEAGPVEAASGAIKITGAVDYACQAYGAINAVGYAAKTIRAVQLARYAIVFWNAADEIKATGGLKPETAAFLGSTLTAVTKDAKGTIVNGSGTDSFGYKYAAYGDTTGSKRSMNIANRFLAGGGFTGDLINFSSTVESYFPGGRQGARDTCGVLANPIVGGVSLVAGAASLFVPGANVGLELTKAAVGASIGLGLALLPSLLSDIIAGTTTANINGEATVDAVAGGGGKILSDTVPRYNGMPMMNTADASNYLAKNQAVAATYGKDESIALSPLDPTNQYTFLGSIVSKILPIAGSIHDGGTFLSSFGSLLTTSFSSIMPTSSALTTQQYTDSLKICQDKDAADAGYAVDPFCNVVRGIPLQYLNKDPNQVVDELITAGDLTPDTQVPTQQYTDFINKCIDTQNAPGYDTKETTGFDAQGAKDCIINDSNADRFLNFVDTRVEAEKAGEDVADTNSSPAATTGTAGATIDQAHIYDDSSAIACAPGTTDAGINQGYKNGVEINIRLCSIPGTLDYGYSSKAKLPMRVNSRISGAMLALVTAFKASPANRFGATFHVADSFRSMADQAAALAEYGPTRAAKPGYSNHQMGIAVDFQLGSNTGVTRPGDPAYDWLVANAKNYGIAKLSTESWHWQPLAAQGSVAM